MADNPELTCRIAGFRTRPLVRVVADSHLRTRLTARLLASDADTPSWFLTRTGTDPVRIAGFEAAGATILPVPGAPIGIDVAAALQALGSAGITRLLVEGGGQLAAALLRADLVDRVAWFHAPGLIGGDGWPAVAGFGMTELAAMPRFTRTNVTPLGNDLLTEFERAA
jgi:diaminohydroxyphosphoribosylaminopyrimidine deaminase/5-amino-6-(5-phosphoribosylamino)uracil reductase